MLVHASLVREFSLCSLGHCNIIVTSSLGVF